MRASSFSEKCCFNCARAQCVSHFSFNRVVLLGRSLAARSILERSWGIPKTLDQSSPKGTVRTHFWIKWLWEHFPQPARTTSCSQVLFNEGARSISCRICAVIRGARSISGNIAKRCGFISVRTHFSLFYCGVCGKCSFMKVRAPLL